MAEEKENLSQEQIGDLIRRLLGLPEDWDDDAAEFILQVQGIDPATSRSYVKDLILSELENRRLRRMEVPPILLRMLSSVSAPLDAESEAKKAEDYLRVNLERAQGDLSGADERLLQAARPRPGEELDEEDRKILKDLEEELTHGVDRADEDEEEPY